MASRGVFAILTFLVVQKGISVFSQSLNVQPEKSLCRQYHRINATKQVSYMSTYLDDWNYPTSRVDFRIDTVTKWMMIEMCCEGYEPSQIDDSSEHCVPVCPSGCQNGVCQHPNSCLCNPGYDASVDNVTRISECLAHCSSGCVGGECIAPETCSCYIGYDLTDDSTSCKPSCHMVGAGGPENCGDKAICVAPNACQCGDGYAPRNWMINHQEIALTKPIYYNFWEIDCFPVCEQGCPKNAVCFAPNTCECVSGYQQDNVNVLTECLPVCEKPCHNGLCEYPDSCRCDDGYKAHEVLGSNFCEPDCQDGCVNGKCVRPNQCECLSGYEALIIHSANQSEYSGNICVASCADCGHGTCVAPNQCHCDPGYVPKEVSRPISGDVWQTCQPFCDPSCHDELACLAPNHCQLLDTDSAHLQNFQARIVEFSSNECGHDGLFSEKNGNCMCHYPSNMTQCTEPLLCAVIIVHNNETAEEFSLLERVIVLDQTNDIPELYRSTMLCKNECRISIFTNKSVESIRNDTEQCYAINLHDSKIGLMFNITENLVPISDKMFNGSLICFLNTGFQCDIPNDGIRKIGRAVTAGVIAGAVFLVAIIFALILTIYLTRKKIRKLFAGSPRKNETMMDRSETMDSPFHTDDTSHL